MMCAQHVPWSVFFFANTIHNIVPIYHIKVFSHLRYLSNKFVISLMLILSNVFDFKKLEVKNFPVSNNRRIKCSLMLVD